MKVRQKHQSVTMSRNDSTDRTKQRQLRHEGNYCNKRKFHTLSSKFQNNLYGEDQNGYEGD
jgi:hypothetical protein